MPTFAFGYLRRLPGMDKEAVRQVVAGLADFTKRQGFELAGVHYEARVGAPLSTWCRLIAACRNEGVTDVVVPNGLHFHRSPELAAFMREELATTISGTVWLADEAGTVAAGEAVALDAS